MKLIKTIKSLKGQNLINAIEFLNSNYLVRIESPISAIAHVSFLDKNKEINSFTLFCQNNTIVSVGICLND